jgi:hypothetical protein
MSGLDGALASCNQYFMPPKPAEEYLQEDYLKHHSYLKLDEFLTSQPKAYVNQIEIPPQHSYLEFKDIWGKQIETGDLTGEEIIGRSLLNKNDPLYLDPTGIAGQGFYHGDDIEFSVIEASGGFKHVAQVEIVDQDLVHHTAGSTAIGRYAEGSPLAGKKINSAFMGSTAVPIDVANDAVWGKYIYDFRGVPGWNIQSATRDMVLSDADKALLQGISGEMEIAIPRNIPLECLLRIGTISVSAMSGRNRIGRWEINPSFNSQKCRKYFGR